MDQQPPIEPNNVHAENLPQSGASARWCRYCFYNLRGLGDPPFRCPECGKIYRGNEEIHKRRNLARRTLNDMMGIGFAMATTCLMIVFAINTPNAPWLMFLLKLIPVMMVTLGFIAIRSTAAKLRRQRVCLLTLAAIHGVVTFAAGIVILGSFLVLFTGTIDAWPWFAGGVGGMYIMIRVHSWLLHAFQRAVAMPP